MRISPPRSGLTLIELMVVLALLIILAATALPSFSGLKGNADQKAAADLLRARIADARSLALQESVPYRLAVSPQGTKLRLGPDTPEFASMPASDEATGGARVIETTLVKATVMVVSEADAEAEAESMGSDQWITIATFLANGTCREDSTLLEVNEVGFPPITILLRGVTGTARVVPLDSSNGGMK